MLLRRCFLRPSWWQSQTSTGLRSIGLQLPPLQCPGPGIPRLQFSGPDIPRLSGPDIPRLSGPDIPRLPSSGPCIPRLQSSGPGIPSLQQSHLQCPGPVLRRPQAPPSCLAAPRCLVPGAPRWLQTSASLWSVEYPRKPTTGDGQVQTDHPQTGLPEPEPDPLQDPSMGLVQRFKQTLKQCGKVLVPVHLVTSTLWAGTFYYAAMKGVNIVPFLEVVGFPQRFIDLLQNSQGGYALTAYAMYKIATPARYTVTLGGTSLCVGYLRRHGYMSTPPPVKDYLQGRMEERRERLTERMEEAKDKVTSRLQEAKDKVTFRKKPE